MKLTRRRLPHITVDDAVYSMTFRIKEGRLREQERDLVMTHVMSGRGRFYSLFAAAVMPDHVHLVVRPLNGISQSRMMKGIKGVSARIINESRGTTGRVWLDESYDTVIRDENDLWRRCRYVYENPVRSRLASSPEEYRWVFFSAEG